MNKLMLAAYLLALPSAVASAGARHGEPPDSALYRTVAALDSDLFDAFNRCDLVKLGAFVTEDLEFYHDQTGLSRSRQTFLDAVRRNVCGKVRRVLVEGSLEVHALAGYGAVEIGVHRFHHPGADAAMAVGQARFVHLWENKGGAWRLARVVSFDHGPAE